MKNLNDMKFAKRSLVLLFIIIGTIYLFVSPVLRAQQADFAIFFSPEDAASSDALATILQGNGDSRIIHCSTVQEAVTSNARVLVLFMDYQEDKNFNEDQLEALKKYKVLAIDFGAAELFHRLGLEIHGGACVHDYNNLAPKINVVENALFDVSKHNKTIPVFTLTSNEDPVDKNINYAMFIHPKSHLRTVVDVIATSKGDDVYAPIVKQGNCMMVGLAAPVSTWTTAYKEFFHDFSKALLHQPLKPFETVQWKCTRPGTFSFKLAQLKNKNEMYNKTFYFKFKEPTNFKIHLGHANSNHVTVSFMGPNKEHWNRLDAEQGKPLELNINISEADINNIGDRYWQLSVINFDEKHSTDCELKIEY